MYNGIYFCTFVKVLQKLLNLRKFCMFVFPRTNRKIICETSYDPPKSLTRVFPLNAIPRPDHTPPLPTHRTGLDSLTVCRARPRKAHKLQQF